MSIFPCPKPVPEGCCCSTADERFRIVQLHQELLQSLAVPLPGEHGSQRDGVWILPEVFLYKSRHQKSITHLNPIGYSWYFISLMNFWYLTVQSHWLMRSKEWKPPKGWSMLKPVGDPVPHHHSEKPGQDKLALACARTCYNASKFPTFVAVC